MDESFSRTKQEYRRMKETIEERLQILRKQNRESTLRMRALEKEVKDMLYTLDKLTNPNLYN